jgi:guanylate kinase
MADAPLLVVSGPSGVGKSTVVAAALALDPGIWLSVSATTRSPRPGEVDGREYFFVTDEEFDDLVATGGLLEWAAFAGNRYGTPRAPVQEHRTAGTPVLLEIEVQGARQVRQAVPSALLVFLAPPSWEVLRGRLTGRGTESPDAVARRLQAARDELAAAEEFDCVLVNADVGECARSLLALVADPTSVPRGRVPHPDDPTDE